MLSSSRIETERYRNADPQEDIGEPPLDEQNYTD